MKNTIEVEEKHTGRYCKPGQPRCKKREPTKKEIMRRNQLNAEKQLRRIINLNFDADDFHTILTYRKEERPDVEKSRKILSNWIVAMRRQYKKLGQQFKYVVVTEYVNKAIHHHVIINNIIVGQVTTIKLVKKTWKYGRPKFVPLDDCGDYKNLAEYLIKETSESFKKKDNPNKQRYSCSRNLKRPTAERKIMKRKHWLEEPRIPKGYFLDKNSIHEGINPFTGYRYRYYTFIKLKRRIM